jgi:hypothetical protein
LEIQIKQLRNVEVEKSRDEENVTITLTEMDGNYYGGKTDIKIPATSYCFLEEAIVEIWLEKKKDQIQYLK